ncbi:helix-turn-helix domain-containing protein [Ramlibacter tataouinensis]|uniref:Signal transduction protein: sensor, GAF domain transcriptional regulator, Fis family-like protein n=1 Tax=Ramlibacter tataouinensis (strain ATCC BAA-407 / DSM 14655 / LMG 21543 / TTB310) TaxID=365046 RepID=F5Y3E9_RAMTT|nr:helix-turn-helix domain-containing protein [Ramlibacter tataouinensis]AEG92423.1 signal transduction protein : sensor, GAF domain; transcriptional regulator, Fis family-like protein [Ramlibacter tataouinensis TTB310]
MNASQDARAQQRLQQIAQARDAVMAEGRPATEALVDGGWDRSWIARSWRRCLDSGRRPQERVSFDLVPAQAARRVEEASQTLLYAARPVMERLCRAIANTRYFAILTDAEGVVIHVDGAIDRTDRRAQLITRIGVDLSERAVGTTAIGAVLAELQPVWLHRGEHFFEDTSVYSCAGAPLFGPDGRCVGMLDLTGIETLERPELKHLVAQSARSIENALALSHPHALLLRLNWPGRALGDDGDGLVCVDADGWVLSVNATARQMVSGVNAGGGARVHCSELFAVPWEVLFDAARQDAPREVPLWSGLTLQVLAQSPGQLPRLRGPAPDPRLPLKDLETELIRKAVNEARGNVMQAARVLGISRATVYRKLGTRPKG